MLWHKTFPVTHAGPLVQLPLNIFSVFSLFPVSFPGINFLLLLLPLALPLFPYSTPSISKIKLIKAISLTALIIFIWFVCNFFIFMAAEFDYIIKIIHIIFCCFHKYIWMFNYFNSGKLHYFPY